MEQNESKGISNIGINFSYYLAERREKEEGEKQSVKEKYASLKDENAIINLKFDFSNADGDLLLYEDDWKIVLRNGEILGRNYEPKKRMAMLLRNYAVKILEINEPEKCIFVSCTDVRNKDRDRLREILDSKHDGIVKVPAKVVYVYPNMLILDIGGLGIPGFLKIADWSLAYTIALQTVVKRGDVFEIEVMEKYPPTSAEAKKYFGRWLDQSPYKCSRKTIMEHDPWKDIEERLHEGDIVTVQCESKYPMNFYGRNKSFPDLVFYGHYKEDGNKIDRKSMVIGKNYECFVKKVSEKERQLRVKAVREVLGE